MADYTPIFLPGITWTSRTATAVTAGDPLEVAGHDLVQPCTAGPSGLGSACFIGVAAHDAKISTDITVISNRPIHEGLADGSITAGDQLMASPVAGRQVQAVPATGATPSTADVDAARVIIGIALQTATDGATLRWQQTG